MNGNTVPILLWIANAMMGLVIFLLGAVLKMHSDSDKDYKDRTDKEIDLLRKRGHDIGNKVSEILTRIRWLDEDAKK